MSGPHTSKAIEEAGYHIISEARSELRAQGHRLSGQGEQSLRVETVVQGDSVLLKLLGFDYLMALNEGVPSNRIPFSPGSRAGHSLYITGLVDFALKRGMATNEKEALAVAFAIAHKHKQAWSPGGFGMPTEGSYKYSSNGARTGWLDRVMERCLETASGNIAMAIARDFNDQLTKLKI